jgi:hypothetical protein
MAPDHASVGLAWRWLGVAVIQYALYFFLFSQYWAKVDSKWDGTTIGRSAVVFNMCIFFFYFSILKRVHGYGIIFRALF